MKPRLLGHWGTNPGLRLTHLGIAIDSDRNELTEPLDREISLPTPLVRTLVVQAREDLEIAAQTREALGSAAPS